MYPLWTATHPTDHPIKDELTHVIWAKGQEPGRYIHSPSSGLEAGQSSSIPDFYRPDEIKYHGKRDQRGVTSINFMGERDSVFEWEMDSRKLCIIFVIYILYNT